MRRKSGPISHPPLAAVAAGLGAPQATGPIAVEPHRDGAVGVETIDSHCAVNSAATARALCFACASIVAARGVTSVN
jgi:hypothetical protein